TVRIYGMHAGLGVERLVISNKALKESYLGPDKTFMLDYDIIPEQKNGIHHEAAAGALSYGKPSNLSAITDPSDRNDAADSYEQETPIPRPKPPITDDTSSGGSGNHVQTQTPAQPVQNPPVTPAKNIKKGKTYKYKGYKYKVTSLTKTGGTVSVTAPTKKTIKKAVIPSSVKIKGRTLKVTAVGNKAFKNWKKLKSVTIGANIKKIGAGSFAGCAGLKKITVKSYKLKAVGKKAFSGISNKAVLKAPAKLKKKYSKLIRL
ncbi:MAG: leucine-rich repeat protein, partial [Lachnospiraceae bacterium]|nr:leucine-rich repeat protein [Lachnospiraceae bacterium]